MYEREKLHEEVMKEKEKQRKEEENREISL